jgi:hypothetical protein
MPRCKNRQQEGNRWSASRLLVDRAAFQIAIALAVLGAVLLYIASEVEGQIANSVDATVREVGALLFAAGILSVFWELLGRRALTSELLDAARLSADIQNAGLTGVTTNYLDVEWNELLERAREVDVFFAYGQTWRTAHATTLRELIEHKGVQLRVVLPDHTNAQLMAQLADKFQYSPEKLVGYIDDAEHDIANLHRLAADKSIVELRRTKGRFKVPTFELEKGGWLSEFFHAQFDALWKEASVRRLDQDMFP